MNLKKMGEFLGWYGTIAILLAYVLVSFQILTASSIYYQLLNLTGALGVAYISFSKKAYQPGVLNAVWAVIALIALISILR